MRLPVATRYALRSVRRNTRRTALSVLGIGIGVGLALFVDGINRGRAELFVRATALSGTGHLRIVPRVWRVRRDPDLRLADGAADLQAARALPGVAVATLRARVQALLAMGTHVVPLELLGVDPALEPAVWRFARHVERGRYLEPGDRDAGVIGRAVAERLGADLGDEVLASAVAKNGEIVGAMIRVVGIVSTGSDEVDAGICQVPIAALERLTGRAGPGEIAVTFADWRTVEAERAGLVKALAPGDEVMTWKELTPDFEGHMRQDTAASRIVTAIIILIVLLGVTSAQLAAVLERRREFAVLGALGMSGRRMAGLVIQEAVALGLGGGLAGLAIGGSVVWHFARAGLDFRRVMGGSYAFAGLLIDPVIYPEFGAWLLVEALSIALLATLLASLYPARFASRTDPAVALRVAQ